MGKIEEHAPTPQQKKMLKNFTIFVWGAVLLVLVINFLLGFYLVKRTSSVRSSTPMPSVTTVQTITYDGSTGKDALTLLREKANVGQSASGLVTSINGRVVDNSNHEYWAFYVNGKLASVGPADYQTKNGDKIEWKIEKY